CPQRDVVDHPGFAAPGDPASVTEHQCHDDAHDDAKRIRPDRYRAQIPDALWRTRNVSQNCRRHAVILCRTPSASSAVSDRTAGIPSFNAATNADPTMTPSAKAPISAACSRDRTPSPTPTGMSDTAFTRRTSSGAATDTASRAPVTPIVEAAYTNPRDARTVSANRSGVDDGATKKIRSKSRASDTANRSSASSGIKSGVIIPSPPAEARSRANASTPHRNTGFQYVITTARPPALLIASTAASASRTRTPPRNAASVAAAITGPSIPGSEYAIPTSMMSQPDSTIAVIAEIDVGTSGNPVGRYPISAERRSARHTSNNP